MQIEIEKTDINRLVKISVLNVIDSAITNKGLIEWKKNSIEEENDYFEFHITGFPLDQYYGRVEFEHFICEETGKSYSQIKTILPEIKTGREVKFILELNEIISDINSKFKESPTYFNLEELRQSIFNNLTKTIKI